MQARMWMLGKAAENISGALRGPGACVVAAPGLEPGCPKARHFECRVSTYSTTLPFGFALSEVQTGGASSNLVAKLSRLAVHCLGCG